jgi:hypothetical protein
MEKIKEQKAFDHPGSQAGRKDLAHERVWQKRI